MSTSIDFQHSQPQSVYRPKDRFMSLLLGAMLAGICLYWAYNFIREPSFLTIINVPIWLWWAYSLARNALRNRIERCFNRLKQCRSVATRYDKTATSYQATVTIAALLQWL